MYILECTYVGDDVICFASLEPARAFVSLRPFPGQHLHVQEGKHYHLAMVEAPSPAREPDHVEPLACAQTAR
jgi:hypothetical protein